MNEDSVLHLPQAFSLSADDIRRDARNVEEIVVELYEKLRPSLLAYVYHLVGSTRDAEDIVQIAFLTVLFFLVLCCILIIVLLFGRGIVFMYRTRVTRKGQTVVPASLRKQFGIGPSSRLVWTTDGNVIRVTPLPADPVKALRGFSEKHPLRKVLLRKRREDKAFE